MLFRSPRRRARIRELRIGNPAMVRSRRYRPISRIHSVARSSGSLLPRASDGSASRHHPRLTQAPSREALGGKNWRVVSSLKSHQSADRHTRGLVGSGAGQLPPRHLSRPSHQRLLLNATACGYSPRPQSSRACSHGHHPPASRIADTPPEATSFSVPRGHFQSARRASRRFPITRCRELKKSKLLLLR